MKEEYFDEKVGWTKTLLIGFQHVLTMCPGTIAVPLILAGALGLGEKETAFLVAANFFTSGIAILIQVKVGLMPLKRVSEGLAPIRNGTARRAGGLAGSAGARGDGGWPMPRGLCAGAGGFVAGARSDDALGLCRGFCQAFSVSASESGCALP